MAGTQSVDHTTNVRSTATDHTAQRGLSQERSMSGTLGLSDEPGNEQLASPNPAAPLSTSVQDLTTEHQNLDTLPTNLVGQTLEAELFHDRDSALGDDDVRSGASSFTSVGSANFHHAYGKRYHAYSDAHYILPNNEQEIDRLELQHRIWEIMLTGRLHLAPIRPDISRAIDLGCGTGAWAIDFADTHPECDVIGLDLSPIQPDNVPVNLTFIVDDAAQDWAFGAPFDYIHTRAIASGIKDWQSLIDQAFRSLKPGGWLELQEFHLPFKCDDGSLPPESVLTDFNTEMLEAFEKTGVKLGQEMMQVELPRMINETGFVNLDTARSKWPIGPWAKGEKEKRIGALFLKDVEGNTENLTKRIMMGVLGYTEEEVAKKMDVVLKDMRDSSIHMHMPIDIIWAQRPFL